MNTCTRLALALLAGLLMVLSGCVQISSIPGTAHAGDNIVLGIGGINRNWGGEKPRNLQISITDANHNTFPLQASVIFQAYPDYRAGANIVALQGADGLQLQPFDGAWFLSVGLVDANGPLPLAIGPATIHVAADNLTVVRDAQGNLYDTEGDLTRIPVQIIAGPPNSDNAVAQYGAYDNRGTHFLLRPAAPAATVGGAYYVVNYQSDSNFGDLKPMPFPVSHNPFVKMDYKLQDNGNGNGTYYIYVYNPAGFTATLPHQPKQAPLQDLGVHFEYFDANYTNWMKQNLSLDTGSSYFIDLNGNRIDGLQAEMKHADEL